MEAPIGVEDIRGRIERPLTPDEERTIPAWIADALQVLVDEVPRLEQRLALEAAQPDAIAPDTLKSVLGRMVERKVRNAAGVRSYGLSDGSSVTVDNDLSSGEIYVSPAELARFAPRPIAGAEGGFYSIPLGF